MRLASKRGEVNVNFEIIRKSSLKIFICFLIITALFAIVSVLSGEMGDFQLKTLATTFTISAASICSMSCAAFIEKRRMKWLGISGILLSIAAAAFLIAGLWPEVDSHDYWKFTGTLITLAVCLAHAFLLYLPELDDDHNWVQPATAISIGTLALLIMIAVWGEIDDEGYYRLLAAVSIVVALGSLVVPILMKMQKGSGPKKELLILEKTEGDTYRDSAGKQYIVKEIDTEESTPADTGKQGTPADADEQR